MFTLGYALPAVEGGEGDRRRRRRSATTSATPRASTASSGRSASTTGVVARDWSSADARWTVDAPSAPTPARRCSCTCAFLFGCTGYYRYDEGFTPQLRGRASASPGEIVHPQHWPEDLDYTGKRVVVIGSGATAVTLVPAHGRATPRT